VVPHTVVRYCPDVTERIRAQPVRVRPLTYQGED